jgi:hypothetical protein
MTAAMTFTRIFDTIDFRNPSGMSKRIKISALVLAAIALGALLIGIARHRSRSLLDNATPIRGYMENGKIVHNSLWLDNHTYITTDAQFPRTQILKVDVETGTRSVLADVSLPPVRVQGKTTAIPGMLARSIDPTEISPDRTRVLLNSTDGWQLVNLSTGKTRRLRTGPANNLPSSRNPVPIENAAWMPDSREWVTLDWSLTKPTTLTVRDLSGRVISTGNIGQAPASQLILGTLPGGVVLLSEDDDTLSQVDTRHGFRIRSWPFPQNYGAGNVSNPQLSPDKRHLLWRTWSATIKVDPSNVPDYLRRILLEVPGQFMDIYFVSDLYGAHQHEVGRCSSSPGSNVQNVRWMRDGRHISFLYGNRFWSVPVDTR